MKLQQGAVTRIWLDLEHQGRKYEPGKDDLLVSNITTGWMEQKLFGQGLKKEFDHERER